MASFPGFGFYDFTQSRQGLSLPKRPEIDDLLDPEIYPEYPDYPELLTRSRDLDKGGKRQLTMAMLANIAQALSGGQGNLGGRLAAAASANIGTEQDFMAQANERQERDYQRKVREADRQASSRAQQGKRSQDRAQIESMLAVGDKAIELAGGADADPKFATKVFSLMRERNASALNAALDEAVQRRTMREEHGLDPDDPMELDAYKRKQELEGKVEEFNTLDPLRSASETKQHATNRIFDLAHPTPREPSRDRLWFDATSGQIINLDSGQASQPIGDYTPRPRSGGMFDDVEKEAMDAANRARNEYDSSGTRPLYQNRNSRLPGYTQDPRLLGTPVPFDYEATYRANERIYRKIANEKAAQADPSTGRRGAAPVTTPTARGVQSPAGAPVGMGGGPQQRRPAAAGLSETEKKTISAEASRRWQKLTPEQRRQFGSLGKYIQAAMQAAAKGR